MILKIKLTPEQIREMSEYSEGIYEVCVRYDTDIPNTSWQRSPHIDLENPSPQVIGDYLADVMKEQDATLKLIKEIWAQHSVLRFGQLIECVIKDPKRLWGIMDKTLLCELKAFQEECKP